jgi:hypothetical protein
MAKTKIDPSERATALVPEDAVVVIERLRRHLAYLGLTHTLASLDSLLAWATRERPGHTALLEHVLGAEVDHKSAARLERRISTSGLVERKTLEAFDNVKRLIMWSTGEPKANTTAKDRPRRATGYT